MSSVDKNQTVAQAAESVPALDRDRIREIFMAHGFTVKEGQTDLKQYVYDAADALLRAARDPADSVQEDAALPDECEMLKHALWLASSFTVHRYLMSNAEGRWSGAEKATCHDELCCLYVAVFRGVEVDRVRVDLEADWMAVHDATQELTDHMDVVIGFPLKGVPDYEALAPKFFAYFHRLAAHAIRASHGQAPAEPEGISREDWIEQAVRVYLIAGDTDEQAQECAAYLWGELDMDDLADPYDAAMSDIEGRNMPRKETQ